MLLEYSHTNSESLAQISTPMAEIQIFFLRDCFLFAHPVYTAKVIAAVSGILLRCLHLAPISRCYHFDCLRP